uniref:Gal_mutarotas_2 domain-containing protein n=1 Tax=Heterorhabditis bacteriophora TaxID=37862 RepID=A0A1I7X0U3_HETBA
MWLGIASLLLSTCWAVNRNDFKTCDQSGFCKRHRSITASDMIICLSFAQYFWFLLDYTIWMYLNMNSIIQWLYMLPFRFIYTHIFLSIFLDVYVDMQVIPGDQVPHFDAHFISETGIIDVFFFTGPTPQDVQKQYSRTTGVTPLPPLFSLGYHQCRWNYNDEQDVAQVYYTVINAGFDKYDIPMDAIWLDIEHTDGKKYFTWDQNKFVHPKEMIEGVASKGRKMVTIIDPHIKKDSNYAVYKDAKDQGLFVKRADGVTDFEGHCWPGASEYLDFLNPETRKYWAAQFIFDRYIGSTPDLFTWNDMNEPSVFSGPEVTMDKDALHFGGIEHREVRVTVVLALFLCNRIISYLVILRSAFIGSQRTTALWTGDNTAEWSHLAITVPMLLSLSISGLPFVGWFCTIRLQLFKFYLCSMYNLGADVGGFFGNPDEQLLIRWYQAGAFQPFFRKYHVFTTRSHSHIDTRRREPWLFSEATRLAIREAIRRRYALLPYWLGYIIFLIVLVYSQVKYISGRQKQTAVFPLSAVLLIYCTVYNSVVAKHIILKIILLLDDESPNGYSQLEAATLESEISMSVVTDDTRLYNEQQRHSMLRRQNRRSLDVDTEDEETVICCNVINVEPVLFLFSVSIGFLLTSQPLFTYWARCMEIAKDSKGNDEENITSICAVLSGSNNSLQNKVERDISSMKIWLQGSSTVPLRIGVASFVESFGNLLGTFAVSILAVPAIKSIIGHEQSYIKSAFIREVFYLKFVIKASVISLLRTEI